MRVVLCAAVAAVSLLSSPAGAAISEDLVFCSKLTASKERLACYDAAARIQQSAKPSRHSVAAAAPAPSSVQPREVVPISLPTSRFAGTYVFGFGGYSASLNSREFEQLNLSAFGAGVGYNFTAGGVLIGLEARGKSEFGENKKLINNYDQIAPFPLPVCCGETTVGYKQITTRQWSAGAGGDVSVRFGVHSNDWLLYGKLGAGLQDLVLAYTDQLGPYTCVNPVIQPGPPNLIVSCGSIRDDSITTRYPYSGIATYLVAGIGIEKNFGSVFARIEGEVKTFGPTVAYDTTRNKPFPGLVSLTLPNFISISANAAIGYRF